MWLITTLIAAIGTTILWYVAPRIYKLDLLSMMLWGASFMILVDHILGYDGGSFVEMETGGLITNGIVIGIIMLLPVFIIWITVLIIKKTKTKYRKEVKKWHVF
jgi:ABC-type transport system involved in multi-copper enzyme maturation permease subunit